MLVIQMWHKFAYKSITCIQSKDSPFNGILQKFYTKLVLGAPGCLSWKSMPLLISELQVRAPVECRDHFNKLKKLKKIVLVGLVNTGFIFQVFFFISLSGRHLVQKENSFKYYLQILCLACKYYFLPANIISSLFLVRLPKSVLFHQFGYLKGLTGLHRVFSLKAFT